MTMTKVKTHRVYALAVCFSSLIVFVVCLGDGIYSAIGVVSPQTTIPRWRHVVFESNEDCLESWKRDHKDEPVPSDAEVTAMRNREHERAMRQERGERRQDLLQYGIAIALSGGVFLVHWRLAKRENGHENVS